MRTTHTGPLPDLNDDGTRMYPNLTRASEPPQSDKLKKWVVREVLADIEKATKSAYSPDLNFIYFMTTLIFDVLIALLAQDGSLAIFRCPPPLPLQDGIFLLCAGAPSRLHTHTHTNSQTQRLKGYVSMMHGYPPWLPRMAGYCFLLESHTRRGTRKTLTHAKICISKIYIYTTHVETHTQHMHTRT